MTRLMTPYENIVCEERIGLSDKQWYMKKMQMLAKKYPEKSVLDIIFLLESEKEIGYQDILEMGLAEKIRPAENDTTKNLLLIIDPQFDFEDNGTLAVSGAADDIKRLTRFIYNNLENITEIITSLDTHSLFQVFSGCCWKDENENYVKPYTTITKESVKLGKYNPVMHSDVFVKYLEGLEKMSKNQLTIWTQHRLEFTKGWLPEQELVKMIYFHEAARKIRAMSVQKGQNPYSEMYGIFKEEYSKDGKDNTNVSLMRKIATYDKILVAGEAMSHCVLASLEQFLEYFEDRSDITSKVYLLCDCSSCIPGTEEVTMKKLEELKVKYHINIVKSTEIVL